MDEKKTTARRRRRSTATLERLETARQRRVAQLERARENERRVDEALGPFAEAETAIETLKRKRDERVAALREQLERKLAELDGVKAAKAAECDRHAEEVRADVEMEIADWRRVMAASVLRIREADVGVSETATLLGLSPKDVTALTREGLDSDAVAASSAETPAVPPTCARVGDGLGSRAPETRAPQAHDEPGERTMTTDPPDLNDVSAEGGRGTSDQDDRGTSTLE
ncbi:hypothetical protein [Amycolatopsis sp. lyj-112]|uniref:hypothetical protein n=1 Tax=Amycolatopsis sp. lyj-112 TaxID=2789288 RepID=UPI00397AE3F1